MDKLLDITGRWISDSFHRALNFRTFIVIGSVLLSLAMILTLLLTVSRSWRFGIPFSIFFMIVFCIVIIIEPYYGLCLLLMLMLLHPEHAHPQLRQFHLQQNLGALTIVSWLVHSVAEKRKIFIKCPQTFLIVAFYIAMLVSTMGAADPEGAKDGLYQFLVLLLSCFMVLSMADTKERIRIIVWIPLIVGLYLSRKGINARTDRWGGGIQLYDINADYGHTNALSMLMVILIPISWSMIFGESRRLLKALSAFACGFYTITNLKTMSRGGFISFGIVIILMLITSPKKARIPTIVICLILVISVPLLAPEGYFDEMRTTMTHEEQSADVRRVDMMKLGIDIFSRSPLFGVGLGGFLVASDGIYSHNTYLQVLAELGGIGFSVFLLLIVFAYRDLWKVGHMLKDRNDFRFYLLLSKGLQISLTGLLFRFFFINALHLNIVYILFICPALIKMGVERELAMGDQCKDGLPDSEELYHEYQQDFL